MKKRNLLMGLFAVSSLVYAEEVKPESKWTGQIIPRIEIEDTNNYGGDEAHPMWIKKLNGTLKHKDYSNWTFIYELREAEKNTTHFFDNVDGTTMYRVYPGIQYSRKVTDKLNLGLIVRDRWQLEENSEGKTNWKVNSYRIAPTFKYQVTDKLDFHGQVFFMKDIYYDRHSKLTKAQRNSTGYEVLTGFTYKFAPGCYFMADYFDEGWDKEHADAFADDGDKLRHQQIRPRLALKLSEKNTIELYGRIQILDGQVTKEDNKTRKLKVDRDRYGFDFIHRINEQFVVNAGFAVEPRIKETGYDGVTKKRDWYYYTARIVYKF